MALKIDFTTAHARSERETVSYFSSGLVYTSLLCRTFVASNAIQTIDVPDVIPKYLLFEMHLTRRKFDVRYLIVAPRAFFRASRLIFAPFFREIINIMKFRCISC